MKKFFNSPLFLYGNFFLSLVLFIFFVYLRDYRDGIKKNLWALNTQIGAQSKILDNLHTTLTEAAVWSKAHHFFDEKKSEKEIRKLATQHEVQFLEYSESLGSICATFSKFSIKKITFCISFLVKNDDDFFSFIKKLKNTMPGFIFSRFVYLEKGSQKQTQGVHLKGNYHFECYYIRHAL